MDLDFLPIKETTNGNYKPLSLANFTLCYGNDKLKEDNFKKGNKNEGRKRAKVEIEIDDFMTLKK